LPPKLDYTVILSAYHAFLESISLIAWGEVKWNIDFILGIQGEDIRMNKFMGR